MNRQDYTREGMDVAKNEKPQEKNLISFDSNTKNTIKTNNIEVKIQNTQ